MSRFANNILPVGVGGEILNSHSVGAARFFFNNDHASDGEPRELFNGSSKPIHTSPDYAIDEVYLWVSNFSGTDRWLTLGTDAAFAAGAYDIKLTITAQTGLVLVYPGLPLGGGKTLYGEAEANDALTCFGFVMRRYRKDIDDPRFGYNGSE